jgi:hypothetical protein
VHSRGPAEIVCGKERFPRLSRGAIHGTVRHSGGVCSAFWGRLVLYVLWQSSSRRAIRLWNCASDRTDPKIRSDPQHSAGEKGFRTFRRTAKVPSGLGSARIESSSCACAWRSLRLWVQEDVAAFDAAKSQLPGPRSSLQTRPWRVTSKVIPQF